jgi:hypothetical protein
MKVKNSQCNQCMTTKAQPKFSFKFVATTKMRVAHLTLTTCLEGLGHLTDARVYCLHTLPCDQLTLGNGL